MHLVHPRFLGLTFLLKYLPASATVDSCTANYCHPGDREKGAEVQGRAQLIAEGFYKARNCALYASVVPFGETVPSEHATAMMRPPKPDLGMDCEYTETAARRFSP